MIFYRRHMSGLRSAMIARVSSRPKIIAPVKTSFAALERSTTESGSTAATFTMGPVVVKAAMDKITERLLPWMKMATYMPSDISCCKLTWIPALAYTTCSPKVIWTFTCQVRPDRGAHLGQATLGRRIGLRPLRQTRPPEQHIHSRLIQRRYRSGPLVQCRALQLLW